MAEQETIRAKLSERSTEELFEILTGNKRDEWRDDAFVVIRQILRERGEDVPDETEEKNDKSGNLDLKICNGSALAFCAILLSIGTFGYIWILLGYLLVAGLSFFACQLSKDKGVKIILSAVVVGLCVAGVFLVGKG